MSDRLMKNRLSEAEQFKLKTEHRELYLLLMSVVSSLSAPGGPKQVTLTAEHFRKFDAFADLSIFKNEKTQDVVIAVGPTELAPEWVKLDKFSVSPLEDFEKLLFKARPHLENGANGHPTDRYDARLILREMDRLGLA